MVIVQAGEERAPGTVDLHVRPAPATRPGGPTAAIRSPSIRTSTRSPSTSASRSRRMLTTARSPKHGGGVRSQRGGRGDGLPRPWRLRRQAGDVEQGSGDRGGHGRHGRIEQPATPGSERLEDGGGRHQAGHGIGHGVGQEAGAQAVAGDQTSGGGGHIAEPHPLAPCRARARGW